MVYLLTALSFGFGFLVVLGANLLIADIQRHRRQEVQRRLADELRLRQRERARTTMQYRDLYELAAEGASDLQHHKPLRERIGLYLNQAGVKLRLDHLVGLALGIGLPLGFVVGFLTGNVFIGAIAAGVAGAAPFIFVQVVRMKRLHKLQSQLPDAFELMGRTMRAGQTISQAFQAVADEAFPPLSEEFGLCYEQQNLGMSPDAALRDLSRRTGLLEVKIFVLAVTVHRQTGGNLADLLEKLSQVIRDRYRIKGMIQSLTAEGRFQAYILFALPLFMLGALFVVNRQYAMLHLEHPGLLAIMVGMMVVGLIWMQKIINFDF